MQYFSTNKQSPFVSFAQATMLGQAPDKGLYYPSGVPVLAQPWQELKGLPKSELAYRIMKPYAGDCMPEPELRRIVAETVDFDFPLVKITGNIYSLELFHGPTLAFKDIGARFMSRCLGYFNKGNSKKITVLVATSGDTGGAVANGFENEEGIEVIILYPSGKVSRVQELQLTTCGANIIPLEIMGTFDDCQAMVKQAFLDTDLNASLQLTSANSINVARWLPQQLYYFFALQQWQHEDTPIISVPSGNFGNICAGMLAWTTGLPVKHFIAACNVNDVVPRFLQSGKYDPKEATATISNAMDVGNPSNFVRIMEMFLQDASKLNEMLSGYTISDETTRQTIKQVWKNYKYILDPHGAVGFKALDAYLEKHPGQKGIFLETAHPVKFPEVVEQEIHSKLDIPEKIKPLLDKEKSSILLPADFEGFKRWMLSR